MTDNKHDVVGKTLHLTILGFNGDQPIDAKVDTGASTCSLNAENLQVSKSTSEDCDVVTFTFNDHKYTMNSYGHEAVQSADGGTKYRPVVKFRVKVGEQTIEDVAFNLNDRSHMPAKVLVGLNLLEKGDFLIDPKMESEEVIEPVVEEEQEAPIEEAKKELSKEEKVQEVLAVVKKYPELTLSDLFAHW